MKAKTIQTNNETLTVKTSIKAGSFNWNHNETEAPAISVKSGVKAGSYNVNYNETDVSFEASAKKEA